jgi:hypothetical protein
MQAIEWKVETWPIAKLKPLEDNPFGKISAENKRRLGEKLRRLGIFEVATIDTNGDLLTFNKRYFLLKEMGVETIDVRVPTRPLTEAERKEIIISSNVHEGEWDKQILTELYADVNLQDLGLDLKGLTLENATGSALEEKKEVEYPIVPKFSEKHSAIVIVVDNEIDLNHIQQILGLGTEKSYKSQDSGTTFVLDAKKFIEAWKSKS